MEIKNQGIYFKQTDERDTGYYTQDNEGNLIHHKYKKPSFWERAKYFATYGYEMNMDTTVTSYFYLSQLDNQVSMGSIVGDAITIAKNFRQKRNFGRWYTYKQDLNLLRFETDSRIFSLEFFDSGTCLKVSSLDKITNTNFSEVYQYLDWDKI